MGCLGKPSLQVQTSGKPTQWGQMLGDPSWWDQTLGKPSLHQSTPSSRAGSPAVTGCPPRAWPSLGEQVSCYCWAGRRKASVRRCHVLLVLFLPIKAMPLSKGVSFMFSPTNTLTELLKLRNFPNQRLNHYPSVRFPPFCHTHYTPNCFNCHYPQHRCLFKFLIQAGGHLIADWIKYCRLQPRISLKIQVEELCLNSLDEN